MIWTCHIFSYLSFSIPQIVFGVYHLDHFLIKGYRKNKLLFEDANVMWWQIFMSHHETWNCYNFCVKGQVCTKLDIFLSLLPSIHLYDNIWINSEHHQLATGNYFNDHVLYFNQLLPQNFPKPFKIRLGHTLDFCDEKLTKAFSGCCIESILSNLPCNKKC